MFRIIYKPNSQTNLLNFRSCPFSRPNSSNSTENYSMGSCISKCNRPKKIAQRKRITPEEEEEEERFKANRVQDKLVISQAPIVPVPLPPNSSSCTSSSSSSTSSSGENSTISDISSASSSVASSIPCLKDRAFSNEFLRACVKENPHIIRRDPIKGSPVMTAPAKARPRNANSPSRSGNLALEKQSIPRLQKQRSFRKELERPESNYTRPIPSRALRSPSPSRRFSSERNRGVSKNRAIGSIANYRGSAGSNSDMRIIKKNDPSASNRCGLKRSCALNSIGSGLDETGGKEEEACGHCEDAGSVLTEDIDNPLISLDCFIFL